MSRVRIKICGLTRPDDAALAVRLGAWALGVVFAPESPRKVSLQRAAEVLDATPPDVERVGVFVNAGPEEMAEAVRVCGLSILQLHGDESPGECTEAQKRTGCQVIKAFRVAGPESVADVVSFDTDFILLDTYHPERRGGSGEVFDWSLVAALPGNVRRERLVLSGGLNPDNIADAVCVVAPFAVDMASGVESAPGVKDPEKMKRLFDIVKEIN